ncbi:MAG: TatD family hydrolase [Gammaproteobacteria bacterium]|nr:TatD family hydrolase [Gammaproteobacteria bacterium]
MIIDSHCHLDKLDTSHYSDGLAGLIAAAQAEGTSQMLCIGVDTEQFEPMLDQIKDYDFIHASAGLHPLGVKNLDTLALLEQQARLDKVVAIGETGLDYFYQQDNAELQTQAFSAHLQLSKRLRKPVIVHTRDANADTLALLSSEADLSVGGVIHCFTEDWVMAKACLDLGFYISISGIITFNNASALRDVVKKIPLDRLLVETDSPYLTPAPHRGTQNEPKHVRLVAQYVADLKGLSLDKLAQATSHNFTQLFLTPR